MKRIKKIAVALIYVLLGLILIYNVYNVINIKILGKDMTSIGGYSMLEVVSGSMEPTIHIGDMIIINTNDKNYDVGNIVTFYDSNNAFVTHRIISKNGNIVVTQGDNNNTEDPEFNTDRIVGKYVGRIQGLGFILKAFQSPITMLLILIVGILVCVLVSTDKEGNPILNEDEKELKEYQEFLKYKEDKDYQEFLKSKNSITATSDEMVKIKEKPVEVVKVERVEVVRKPIKRPNRKTISVNNTIEEIKKIEPIVEERVETKVEVKPRVVKKTASSVTKKATAAKTSKTSTKTTIAKKKATTSTKKSTTKVASSSPKKVEGKKTTKTTTKSKASTPTKKITTTAKKGTSATKKTTSTKTAKTSTKATATKKSTGAKTPKTTTSKTKTTSSKKNIKK